jgi:hypothetical protein
MVYVRCQEAGIPEAVDCGGDLKRGAPRVLKGSVLPYEVDDFAAADIEP